MSASLHFSQKPQDQLSQPFGTRRWKTELFAELLRFRSAWSINQCRQDPKNAAKKNARTHPRPKPPIALFGCCSASPTNAWPKLMKNWPDIFYYWKYTHCISLSFLDEKNARGSALLTSTTCRIPTVLGPLCSRVSVSPPGRRNASMYCNKFASKNAKANTAAAASAFKEATSNLNQSGNWFLQFFACWKAWGLGI